MHTRSARTWHSRRCFLLQSIRNNKKKNWRICPWLGSCCGYFDYKHGVSIVVFCQMSSRHLGDTTRAVWRHVVVLRWSRGPPLGEIPSVCETPEWLRALENVTWASIFKAVSSKWVKYYFRWTIPLIRWIILFLFTLLMWMYVIKESLHHYFLYAIELKQNYPSETTALYYPVTADDIKNLLKPETSFCSQDYFLAF